MTEYRGWTEQKPGVWSGHRDTASVAHGALHINISDYGPGSHGTSIPLPVIVALLEAAGFEVVDRQKLSRQLEALLSTFDGAPGDG